MRLVSLALALLPAWPGVVLAAPSGSPRGPVPAWVTPVAPPPPSERPQGDTEQLLVDEQQHVEGDGNTWYSHHAYAVTSAAGLRRSSEVGIGFASDATLVWHFVRRRRGAESTELLPALALKTIQPEDGLGRGIYDGSKRDVAFLPDVRVGDVIEYAYSIHEKAQVLGGRFSSVHFLGQHVPVRKLHLGVTWPADRQIQVLAFGAEVSRPGPGAVVFDREDVPAYERESHEPAWFESTPRVELSEFRGWGDVVRWALPLYAGAASASVKTLAQTFTGAPAERMARATRFVQDEVRYLGIEEGERALVPDPPEGTLSQRFGDCKDKAYLLVVLLRAMGFEAEPALVSARWERGIAEKLPSPYAFNHVVVHTVLDGQDLWLDATERDQRGPLGETPSLPFGKALLIREGETGLRDLPVRFPREPGVSMREQFTISGQGFASLDVETTYAGEHAAGMRGLLGSGKNDDFEKHSVDFYGKLWGDVTVTAPLEVRDNPRLNHLVVSEHYKVRTFWQDEEQSVTGWLIHRSLPTPETSRAPRPFDLPHPTFLRHVIELTDSTGWSTEVEDEKVESKAFEYHYRSFHRGDTQVMEHELKSRASDLSETDLPAYVEDVRKVENRLESSYITGAKAQQQETTEDFTTTLIVLGVVAGCLVLWGLVAAVRRYAQGARKRRYQVQKRFAPGEAPESAITVSDLSASRSELKRIKCCKAALFTEVAEPRQVRLGEAILHTFTAKCPACGRSQSRYFTVAR